MKILIIASDGKFLLNLKKELIERMSEKDHDIFVSAPESDADEDLKKIGCKILRSRIDRRGLNLFKDISTYTDYKKAIKKTKPDLVITYTIKCNIYGGLAARKYKVPYVANITGLGTAFQRNRIFKTLITAIYKRSLKKAKVVFFENSSNKEVMLQAKIIKETQAVVLKGAGVNLEKFKPLPVNENISTISFLMIGRIMKEKGIDELIYAAKKLKEKSTPCRIKIIGSFEENYLEELDLLKKADILYYEGVQSDIVPFLQECHAVILPSYHEGMSNALLEGAASARPLITSDIPGCREAVIDGETGYLVKARDAEDLFLKMNKFANLTLNQIKNMSQASRAHVAGIFDKEIVVKTTLSKIFDD